MLTIIIGIILVVVLGIIFHRKHFSQPLLLGVILGVFLIFGLFTPAAGHTDWEPKNEINLVSFTESEFVFVKRSPDNVYSYKFEVDKELITKTLKGNVTEIESSDCEKPVLRVYEREAKKNIWVFGFLNKETKYTFFVPEGTIEREISLH